MSNEIKTRSLTPTEQKYTYAQSMQLEGQSRQALSGICVETLPQRAMAFTPLGLIPDPNGNLTNLRQTLIRSSMLYGRIKGFCTTAMI